MNTLQCIQISYIIMGCCTSATDSIDSITYETALPLEKLVTGGKVVKVYDGDTITIAFLVEGKVYRAAVRLNGIDTPEIRGKTVAEKNAGILSRDYVSLQINNKMVWLENVKSEKYGRILANVFYLDTEGNKKCLNTELIEKGLAVPYDGKKKAMFDARHFVTIDI